MTKFDERNGRFTRRGLLKTSAFMGLAGAVGLPSRLLAQEAEMRMWWWGEQELPGLKQVLEDAVASFDAAKVTTMLQDTAVVISQFQTAAAAKEAPDLQYFWNGIYLMESVWLGYVAAANGLVNDQVIADSQPTVLSNFGGNTYRVGWYPIPMVWYYNKDVFERAGLNADAPPKTWDELLAACEKIKGIGVAPVGGGIQDGYWAEWYLAHGLAQNLDSPGQALDLFIGNRDFREPAYHEHWVRLQELKEAGFLNDGMSSMELYPGIDDIVAGKIAMGPSVGTRLPADSKATGGKIGTMVMPVFGKGKMAGKPILDVQGLGISSGAKDPKLAAAFLEHLHSPEVLNNFWQKTGWMPSNRNFDASVIEDAAVKNLWANWGMVENIPHIANLTPGQFYEQAMVPAGQQVVQGEITGEQAGELAQRVVQEWRDFNPDLLESYQKWAEELS